jgi:MULE transposase domain
MERSQAIHEVEEMTALGLKPRHIEKLHRKFPDINITRKDISNMKQYIWRMSLAGRTPIQALLDRLEKNPTFWCFAAEIEQHEDLLVNTQHLRSLWFASSQQIELIQAYQDLLLIDSTYKTNRYKMPLVQLCGCTPLNTFFTAADCFVSGEGVEDYLFVPQQYRHQFNLPTPKVIVTDHCDALKAACREIYPETPQILCIWHLNKNLEVHMKNEWDISAYSNDD